MEPSARCIAAMKVFEGFRSEAYEDAAGVWTLGYGETWQVYEGDTTTEPAAAEKLAARVAGIANDVGYWVEVGLTQGMCDALCSFTYNCGLGAFRGSTLLKKLNAGDYGGCANEFHKWNHAGGRVLAGLTARRAVERGWFSEPVAVVVSRQIPKNDNDGGCC